MGGSGRLRPRRSPSRELPCHVLPHQAQPQGGAEPGRAGLLAGSPRLGVGLGQHFGFQCPPLGGGQSLDVGVHFLPERPLAGLLFPPTAAPLGLLAPLACRAASRA